MLHPSPVAPGADQIQRKQIDMNVTDNNQILLLYLQIPEDQQEIENSFDSNPRAQFFQYIFDILPFN